MRSNRIEVLLLLAYLAPLAAKEPAKCLLQVGASPAGGVQAPVEDLALVAEHGGSNASNAGHPPAEAKAEPAAEPEPEPAEPAEAAAAAPAESMEDAPAETKEVVVVKPPPVGEPPRQAVVSDSSRALRLELRLPQKLAEIHAGPQGPLPQFVLKLKAALCNAAKVPPERLSLLSVRGEFLEFSASMLQDSHVVNTMMLLVEQGGETRPMYDHGDSDGDGDADGDAASTSETKPSLLATKQATKHASKKAQVKAHSLPDQALAHMAPEGVGEVSDRVSGAQTGDFVEVGSVADLEVLPGRLASDITPRMLLRMWQEQLETSDSELRTGNIGEILRGATLILGTPVKDQGPAEVERSAGTRLSAGPFESLALVASVATALALL